MGKSYLGACVLRQEQCLLKRRESMSYNLELQDHVLL